MAHIHLSYTYMTEKKKADVAYIGTKYTGGLRIKRENGYPETTVEEK